MGIRLIAVLLAVLSQVSGELTIGAYNYLVDPGRIFTWRQKWMSTQIELSKSNQGATSVDVTFYVNPSTGIANGVFEVTFPAGFDLTVLKNSGQASVAGQVVQLTKSFPSDTDIRITVPLVTNPSSAGPYGPFAIRTRLHPAGQIIDANLSFGTVYIAPAEGKVTLAVANTSSSNGVINRQGNTLSFKMTLSKSMWAHDIFKVTVPSQFSVKAPNCVSVDQSAKVTNYNGTATDPHILDCVATDKVAGQSQVVWVHGLSVDTDFYLTDDNKVVELWISGFTNPDRVYPSSSYTWTVEILRFNTRNVLESGTANGPTTVAGTLSSATWRPTWGRDPASILRGQTVYMDMTVTLANPLNDGGSVEVTHSGKTGAWGVGTSTQCYLVTNTSPAATCSVDAAQLTTVAGLTKMAAGGSLMIRHLVTFPETDGANKIITVTTKAPLGYVVDTGANLASFSPPATTAATKVNFSVLLQMKDTADASKAGGPGSGEYYLKLRLSGLTAGLLVASSTTIKYSCPIAATAFTAVTDDFQFYFSQIKVRSKVASDGTTNTADFSTGTVQTIAVSAKSSDPSTSMAIVTGSMTIAAGGVTTYKPGTATFQPSANQVGTDLTVGFYAETLPAVLLFPVVASNHATAYECAVDITNSSGGTLLPASGITQFTINYQSFQNTGFTYFCKRGNLPGSPVRVMFLPQVISVRPDDAARTFYVEISMPTSVFAAPGTGTFYGSGMKEGDTYPMDSNISGSPSMTIATVDGAITHRVKGMGAINPAGASVEIYFPVSGALASMSSGDIKLKSYYIISTDTRLKYYTHSGDVAGSYTIDITGGSNGSGFQGSEAPGSLVNGNKLDSTAIDFKLQLTSSITGDSYFYVVLPKGYSFSSFRDVLVSTKGSAAASFPTKKYFSSPSLSFEFPGILVKEQLTGTRISAQELSTISVRGINLPVGATAKDATFVHVAKDGALGEACLNAGTLSITLTVGYIKTATVSPHTVYARGPGAVDTTYTLMFILPHGVDKSGSITFSLNSEWSTTSTTACTVAGLSDLSNAETVLCTNTGNDFTISRFADFNTATNTKVTVLITHLLSPKNDNTDKVSRVLQILADGKSITSKTSGGLLIDTFKLDDTAINGQTKVTVLAPLSAGTTNYQSIRFFPPNANAGLVEMYLKVSFPYDLPSGSQVLIAPPYAPITATVDMRERCHLSPLRYKSCSVSGSNLAIVLDETSTANTALEMFFLQSVTAPTEVPATASPVGFKITTSWSGVTITQDATLNVFTVQPKVTATIAGGTTTIPAIDFSPRNAHESATYVFTLVSSVALTPSDRIMVLWPIEFDPYLGSATQDYKSETGTFYVTCSSSLGTSYCVIDQWMMIVQGTTGVDASKEITITVTGVRNPLVGTTGSFSVFQVNSKMEVTAFNAKLGTVTMTALPKGLDIRSTKVSSRRVASVADYEFSFYMTDSASPNNELRIEFPPELSLYLLTSQTEFTCSATFFDESAAQPTEQQIPTGTSCKLRAPSTVVLPGPSTTTTLTANDRIRIKLANVPTPEWAQVRYAENQYWDFDVWDDQVWTIYSWWTNQFKIFVYQTDTSKVISSRPYSQQNAAYLGFLQPLRTFVVNSYNPQNRANRIIVYPGTQSIDIPITTANSSWPLEAKHVTFTAQVNPATPDGGALTFTSYRDNWVMLQDEWSINFRVAAAATALKGLYFISWSVNEGRQDSVVDSWYSRPPQTLVEVPALNTNVYSFVLDEITPVPVGTTSLPVRVSVTNAPHTDVTVELKVQTPYDETVSVSPSTLKFVPNLNSLYFTITVDESHDFEYVPRVSLFLSLSGTNFEQYSIAPAAVIRITKVYYPTVGKIATIGVSGITRTSFTISPSTDQPGIIYFAVSPRGAKVRSFSELKALMPTFVYTAEELATDIENYADTRTQTMTESDPPAGVEWNNYMHELFSRHMTTYLYCGRVVMRTTTSNTVVTVPGLWADSAYQVVAYLDNLKLNETVSNQYIKYVWTLSIPDPQPVSLRFAGDVAAAFSDSIRYILAKYLGAHPSRLQKMERTQKLLNSRELQGNTTNPPPVVSSVESTTFVFYLAANRSLNWPTPTDEATFSNERINDLSKELKTVLTTTSDLTYEVLAVPTRPDMKWVIPAQTQGYTNTTVTVQYKSSVFGQVCCAALPDSQPIVVPDQVIEGYSYNWTKVPSSCGVAYTNTTIDTLTISELEADTVYDIQCVATDDLPLWPTVMKYTTANSIPFVSFHTPLTNEPEIIPEAGIALQAVALAWFLTA